MRLLGYIYRNKDFESGERGFSVIELMIAMALMVTLMLGFYKGTLAVRQSSARQAVHAEAVRLAQSLLTQQRNRSFATLTVTGTNPASVPMVRQVNSANVTFSVQTVVLDVAANTARRVTVNVVWMDAGVQRTYTATTIVGNS